MCGRSHDALADVRGAAIILFDPPIWERRGLGLAESLDDYVAEGVAYQRPPPPLRVRPRHNHAKSTLRNACSLGGRPLLQGAKCARATRHRIRSR